MKHPVGRIAHLRLKSIKICPPEGHQNPPRESDIRRAAIKWQERQAAVS